MKTCKCGNIILNGKMCRECRDKKKALYLKYYRINNREILRTRSREHAAAKRWLNGGPDNRLMGDEMKHSLRVWDGRSFIG